MNQDFFPDQPPREHMMMPLQFQTVLLLAAIDDALKTPAATEGLDQSDSWECAAMHTVKPAMETYKPGVRLSTKVTHVVHDWVMASEPYRGDALMALHELVGGSGSPDVPVLDELFGAFSMWILDLPASESNHHSWAYGLIDHSLEVGLGAILEMEKAWEEEAEASDPESRHGNLWRLTALAVAFMHDCGKVLEVEIKNSKSGELWNPEREPLAFFKCRNQVYMLGGSDFRFRRGRGLKGHEAKGRELASVILPECGSERTRKYFLDGFDAYVAYYDDAPSARPAPLDQIAAFVRHADELSAAASARKGAPPGKYLQKLTKELEALVYP